MRETDINNRINNQDHHHSPASTERSTHDEHTKSSHAIEEETRNSHSHENDVEKKERKIAMRYRLAVNLAGLALVITGILSCFGNVRAFPIDSTGADIRALEASSAKINIIEPTIQNIKITQVKSFRADSLRANDRAIEQNGVKDNLIDLDPIQNLYPTKAKLENRIYVDTVDLAARNIRLILDKLDAAIDLTPQSLDPTDANLRGLRIASDAVVSRIENIDYLDCPRLGDFILGA